MEINTVVHRFYEFNPTHRPSNIGAHLLPIFMGETVIYMLPGPIPVIFLYALKYAHLQKYFSSGIYILL